MFASQTLKAAGTLLNLPTRHGVPRGSNRGTGARPVGQRWRKWSHHHLLLIGQTEEARLKEATDHTEVKRREAVGGWVGGPLSSGGHGAPKSETVIGCSISHPAQHPLLHPFSFHLYTFLSRQGFPFHLWQATEMSTQYHEQAKKRRKIVSDQLCVCVRVCVRVKVIHLKEVWFVRKGPVLCSVRRRAREAVKSFHWWDSGLLLLLFCTECILEADVSVLRTGWMSESSAF